MKFSQIIGNRLIMDRLKEAVIAQNPFHAYIFEGLDGVGKRLTANTFAQALLCSRSNNGEPCGVCGHCKKMENGNHSDYHYITSDGKSVKDQQIEELQRFVRKKPFDGERSIFIIDQAATITERAQNRLLKTLEEPDGKSVIILLVENMDAIVPTILSRCAVFRFKPVSRDAICEHLIKYQNAPKDQASLAAAFAYGSVGRGQRLLSDEAFQARRKRSIRCAEYLMTADALAYFSGEIKDEINTKEEAIEFLDLMEFWFRDALLLLQDAPEKLLINQDCLQELRKMVRVDHSSGKQLCKIIQNIEETKADVILNVRTQYALKNLFLEMQCSSLE